MNVLWVTWQAKGRDPHGSNPKAGRSHAAINVGAANIRNGSFPLACGRWAPDGFDADITVAGSVKQCARCMKAVEKRQREEGNV